MPPLENNEDYTCLIIIEGSSFSKIVKSAKPGDEVVIENIPTGNINVSVEINYDGYC